MANGDAQNDGSDCDNEYELMTIDTIINGKVRWNVK